MPSDWKKEHAATLRLAPRAWKPAPVEFQGQLYWLHPDGRVYLQKGGTKHSGHGTVRRVKDRALVAGVREAFRRQTEEQIKGQERARQIANRVASPKGAEG